MVGVCLKLVFSAGCCRIEHCCQLAFYVQLVELLSGSLDAGERVAVILFLGLGVAQNNNSQVIAHRVDVVQQIPYALREVYPLVIAFFPHALDFVRYHDAVERVDHDGLKRAGFRLHIFRENSRVLSENLLVCCICAVITVQPSKGAHNFVLVVCSVIVAVLGVVLLAPSFPRQPLFVAVNIECGCGIQIAE